MVILVIFGLWQTDWGKHKTLSLLQPVLLETLNEPIEIQSLSGNLLNSFGIRSLRIGKHIYVDSIQITYSIWDVVIPPHEFASIIVYQPKVAVTQFADSSFSFQQLIKSDTTQHSESTGFPSVHVHNIQVTKGEVEIFAPKLTQQDRLFIQDVELETGIQLQDSGFRVDLRQLDFRFYQPQLNDTIRFALNAQANQDQISIGSLLVATTRSQFELDATVKQANQQAQIEGNIKSHSLSWQDIKSLNRDSPIKENMLLQLGFYGSNSIYGAELNLSSNSMDTLITRFEFAYQKEPVITKIELIAGKSQLSEFININQRIRWDSLNIRSEGLLPLTSLQHSRINLSGFCTGFWVDDIRTDKVSFAAQKVNEQINVHTRIRRKTSELQLEAQSDSVFSNPFWRGELKTKHLNLADLVRNYPIQTNLNSTTQFSGKGFETATFASVRIQTYIQKSLMDNTEILPSNLLILFDGQKASTVAELFLRESELKLSAEYVMNDSLPGYSFTLASQRFNLADLQPLRSIKTDLRFVMNGRGIGLNPATMKAQASIRVDSSRFVGSRLDSLRGDLKLENGFLEARKFTLHSDFADAIINGKGSVTDFFSKENYLDLHLVLKNVEAFAPILGLKDLQARGKLIGKLRPGKEFLSLNSSFELDSIVLDSLLLEAVSGQLDMQVHDSVNYTTSFIVRSPQLGNLRFRDFRISSSGIVTQEMLDSRVDVHLALEQKRSAKIGSKIVGQFAENQAFQVTGLIDEFDFQSVRRTFKLEKPTQWHFNSSTFSVDSLQITSGDAFLRVSASQTDSSLMAKLELNSIDISAAYATVFEPFDAEILSSGVFDFTQKHDSITFNSQLTVSPLRYQELVFDTLFIRSSLVSETLQMQLFLQQEGQKLVELQASLPFKTATPSKDENSFYERTIDTKVHLHVPDLSRFQSFYDSFELGEIRGQLVADFDLNGTLLSPQITSKIQLDSLLLNQVLVDSVRTFVDYIPENHQLYLTGTVHSLQKKVAEIDGFVPLHLDLKNRSKILPESTDKFSLRAKANTFDLSTINNLLDERTINRLSGELSFDLGLSGTFGQPHLDGFFRLNKTRLELVPHRIVLRDIEADINFEKRNLLVKNISLQSNTGYAKASGKIVTKQLQPESVDIQFKASNFQVSDTRNLKARIDCDLNLSGKVRELNLTGSIGALGTDIYLENFGNKRVEAIELEPNSTRNFMIDEIIRGLTTQIKLRIERDVWVRNREYPELNVELFGETDLIKHKNEDFQLFGTFETRRGYARQFSKRFNLDKGEFTFSGNPVNPSLNIETSCKLRQPQDVKIWYIIGGTVNQPTFTFKSEPSMELEDIVSYTIFGRPFAALMGWQQGIAENSTRGGSVSDAAVGLLLDRVESYATEKLGVDVIEIDNSASTTGAGTSVRAGKYINQRTFVAIIQQLGGSDPVSQVVIEYLIKNNLDLILTQSNDKRSGVDIRWRYEY